MPDAQPAHIELADFNAMVGKGASLVARRPDAYRLYCDPESPGFVWLGQEHATDVPAGGFVFIDEDEMSAHVAVEPELHFPVLGKLMTVRAHPADAPREEKTYWKFCVRGQELQIVTSPEERPITESELDNLRNSLGKLAVL